MGAIACHKVVQSANQKRVLNLDEAWHLTGVPPLSLIEAYYRGELPACKLPDGHLRIRRTDLDMWVKRWRRGEYVVVRPCNLKTAAAYAGALALLASLYPLTVLAIVALG